MTAPVTLTPLPVVHPRQVACTVHGPMAWQGDTRTYNCECLTIPAADLDPYLGLTDDEIQLTPPPRSN